MIHSMVRDSSRPAPNKLLPSHAVLSTVKANCNGIGAILFTTVYLVLYYYTNIYYTILLYLY